MTLKHTGFETPTSPIRWDPDGKEWVTVCWAEVVATHGAIHASTWVLPEGWTAQETRQDVTAQADGKEYAHCNQVLLSTTATAGLATITNRVAFADGTELDRSLRLYVDQA
jgi:hypothetical protein